MNNIKKKKTENVAGLFIGNRNKQIGALGEALVVKHLVRKGFEHIESNYSKKHGELDVIMRFEGKIHFFEVKTVSRENFMATKTPISDVNHETSNNFRPEENVNPKKLKKISRMVQTYVSEMCLEGEEWRFHVAAVVIDLKNKKAHIKFIKDIPLNA